MTSTQERDKLRRLADELPDDAVHSVLQLAQVADEVSSPADDVSTVSFKMDGISYEITLDSASAERFRDSLVEFVRWTGRLRRHGGGGAAETTASGEVSATPRVRERPAWIGAGHLGRDFASRAKDVLREEMGQRKA
jgi:hypothetical protein